MIEQIKKFFRKSQLNNERGSVLSVSLIVIALLTFSITTITQVTVNLAATTTLKLEQVSDENIAKGLIKQSISEFEAHVVDVASLTTFNNVEIPRILADYGVVASDVTDDLVYDPLDEFGVGAGGHESRLYKFAYTLADGDVLVKLAYVSNGGTAAAELNPFDFSIGTNGTLIMNGGFYDELNIYGNEIWMAGVAPYVQNGSTAQNTTPATPAVFPVLTPLTVSSIIYATVDYKYCEDISTCFTTNGSSNPFVILESNYIDVDGSSLPDQGDPAAETIYDFFGTFDFDDFLIDYLKTEAPERDQTITDTMTLATAESVIMSYADPIVPTYKKGVLNGYNFPTNSKFVDITGFDPAFIDFSKDFKQGNQYFSFVNQGNLTITSDVAMQNNPRKESMIVFGDLTITGNGDRFDGQIVVFGDLYLTGSSFDIEGTIFVTGETFINMDSGEGFTTTGQNAGFSLVTKDNVHVEEIRENHDSAALTTEFSFFVYTEESIFIDCVNSRLNISGSLFARAAGVSGNDIFFEDELSAPIRGIVINSYRGYINNAGNAVPLTGDTSNRFQMGMIASSGYQDNFFNIPVFDTLITDIDNWTFDTSEFFLE